MTTTETVVVKIGTSSVTASSGEVDHDVLRSLAADVVALRKSGVRCVVVTSGAITAGWADVGAGRARPTNAVTLQALSAVGQPLLMDAWRAAFAASGVTVGQVLLAPLDFAHRGQYLHARATIGALFDLNVVPIVNENDAVADEEIRFGDNDRLAALVANLVTATRLVLLTDTPGLLTSDPRLDPRATLIEEVAAIDREIEALAGARPSAVGSGGMASKLAAARIATWSGVETAIGSARSTQPLISLLHRAAGAGTHFLARPERLPARKAWIAFAAPSCGRLALNDGAVHAVLREGRSALRVGVHEFQGNFIEGDAVDLTDLNGDLFAKGLSRVDAVRWDDGDDVVVHRDDLVVLRSD